MKVDLSKYLTQRYIESLDKQDFEGPVITIARESACPAKKIATRLVSRLDAIKVSKAKNIPWRWINKEILSESARELNLNPSEIEYVFKFEKKNFFDDILSSQSRKYYKSDRQIRKTIEKVIRNIASEGNVIIIGRGGVAITREMERSLHIMLEAPLEWRVARNTQKYCMTEKEATKFCLDVDKNRREFRDYFHGGGTDYTQFDVRYNCMTLSVDEIADNIINLMEQRSFI
ncbi:AAA family ATPase [Bacteroidota bacterium]